MRRVIALVFALLLACRSEAAGTRYYIDGINGSNANDGLSSTTAWKTLSQWKTAILDNVGLLSRSGDEVVISGDVYEPAGVLISFSSYSAPNRGGVTFRQWIPSDGYPSGGTALNPGISRAVVWGAQPLTAIVSGGWSTAGAAGRRQITLTASTDIASLCWRYGQNKDIFGRYYGHLYKCSADGSGANADGVYDSAANASGKRDGFYITGTTLTIDSTFIGTPTTADFIACYNLTNTLFAFQFANQCRVQGLEFRLAIERTVGAYAISWQGCNDCFAYDCVAYDSGHHSFGLSNGSDPGSNCGFIRCVAMGQFGTNGGSPNSPGCFAVSSGTVAGRQDGVLFQDCEGHSYSPLSPQINASTGSAYPTFRSSADYSGTPTRTTGMVFPSMKYSATSSVYGDACSNVIFRRCFFRIYWDTIIAGTGNAVVAGTANGHIAPGQPNNPESYPVRFYDCTFVEAPRMLTSAMRNMAFVRCRFVMNRVAYCGQATGGAILIGAYGAGTDPTQNWDVLFDTCDLVADLHNASAATYMIFHNAGGAAQAYFYRLRFQNSRLLGVLQRDGSGAHNESLIYPGPNGGRAQCYLEFKGCILGFDTPAPTNVTSRLTISDGASSYSNNDLVFAGNVYRNISTGAWSQQASFTTAATWLDRSTGVDKTGVHDLGPDTFSVVSWGGPLGGASSGWGVGSLGIIPGGYSTSPGLGGFANTGAIGPAQAGSLNLMHRGRER